MKKIFEKYVHPFWFTSSSDQINPPYFYGFCLQIVLFSSVIIFLRMAVTRYDSGILAVTVGVITTLAGLYVAVLRLFDVGRKEKNGHGKEKTEPAKVEIIEEDEE